MGYDLYGKKPKSKRGQHFRHSYWGWWEFVGACHDAAFWQMGSLSNWTGDRDGQGMSAIKALELAHRLEIALFKGKVQKDQIGKITALVAFLRDCGGFDLC